MKTSALLAASASALFTLSTAYGGVDASGGIITQVGNDLVHTFTESGTLEVTQGGMVEVLVVGGGGGGGGAAISGGSGGGGSGGASKRSSSPVRGCEKPSRKACSSCPPFTS